MSSALHIVNGQIYDPKNDIDGDVRELCVQDGKIVEFKVMIRPLKAINLIHARMKAMLDRLSEQV